MVLVGMKAYRTQPVHVVLAMVGLVGMLGCGPNLGHKPWRRTEVEVSPGIFIQLEERATSTDDTGRLRRGKYFEVIELRIPWQGTNMHWKGESGPVCLRALDGRLFLITFDRVSKGIDGCLFRYFAQEGSELKEIPPSRFPKAIAGQNLDFAQRYFGGLDRRLDAIQIERDQDPSDIYFRTSMTALIWNHLTTGEQYWQAERKLEISKALLEEYIRVNKPAKLTAIIRDAGEKESK